MQRTSARTEPEPFLFCPACQLSAQASAASCPSCGASQPPAGWPRDPWMGRVVNNRYVVLERLGAGGFGTVLLARQRLGGEDLGQVVLKFMHSELASDESHRRRFVREARAARVLSTSHVVKVFDLDFDEQGVPFMVMEHIQGRTLADLIAEGPLSPQRSLDLAAQIAGALAACHGQGIVHRDLKPSNVIVGREQGDDFVRLIDFGNARVAGDARSRTLIGTPRYMAPEQLEGIDEDERVDIYALGVTLYECLCGEGPFRGNERGAPPAIAGCVPGVSALVDGLLGLMLAADPAGRPASMMEVRQRILAVAGGAVGDQPTAPVDPSMSAGGPRLLAEAEVTAAQGAAAQAKSAPPVVAGAPPAPSVAAAPSPRRGLWALLSVLGAVAALTAMAVVVTGWLGTGTEATGGGGASREAPKVVERSAPAPTSAPVLGTSAKKPAGTPASRSATRSAASSRRPRQPTKVPAKKIKTQQPTSKARPGGRRRTKVRRAAKPKPTPAAPLEKPSPTVPTKRSPPPATGSGEGWGPDPKDDL